jgi:hypothetical protein
MHFSVFIESEVRTAIVSQSVARGVSVSGEKERGHAISRESRIKFSVPVCFMGTPIRVDTKKRISVLNREAMQ